MCDGMYLSHNKLETNIRKKLILAIIKLACRRRYFLPGKVFNIVKRRNIKKGYLIGICGFIGFSIKDKSFLNTTEPSSMFLANLYNPYKKKNFGFQKNVYIK